MEKLKILARTIVEHSLKVKKGEKVLITYQAIESQPLVMELELVVLLI